MEKICKGCKIKFEAKATYIKYCSTKCRLKTKKKVWDRRYPEKVKYKRRKHNAKRDQKGYFEIMKDFFPKNIEVDMHHIRPFLSLVLPMPKITHQYSNGNIRKHIMHNDKWIKKIYCIDVLELMEYRC